MGAFGYTSFLACSRMPEFSFDYGFHSKFQLANNLSALQNNIIFFTGQKGRGKINGTLQDLLSSFKKSLEILHGHSNWLWIKETFA